MPAGAWWIVVVFSLANALGFVDRQILAMVVEPMKRDLGFSDAQIGSLYGAFALFYACASLPIAWLLDRYGRRTLVAAGVALWSIATISFALVRSFALMFAARVGVGVGEATLLPAAYSTFGDILPRSRLPFAMNLYHMGAIVGSACAFILGGTLVSWFRHAPAVSLPLLGTMHAWQIVFIYVGAPSLLIVLLLMTFREPARRRSPPAGPAVAAGSWVQVGVFYRQHWRIVLPHHAGASSLLLLGYSFVFWTPSFFERVHGVPAEQASVIFGSIFLVAGSAGCLLAGWIAQRLIDAGRLDMPIFAPMLGAALMLPLIIGIQVVTGLAWVYALYVPAMFLLNIPYGMLQGAMIQISPPEIRARVASVYMIFTAIGNALGPALVGWLNDDVFTARDGVRFSMLSMCLLFGLLGIALLATVRGRFTAALGSAAAHDLD